MQQQAIRIRLLFFLGNMSPGKACPSPAAVAFLHLSNFAFLCPFFKCFFFKKNVNQCEIISFSFPSCNQVLAITARCCFHYNPNPFSIKFQRLTIKSTLLPCLAFPFLPFPFPDLNAFIVCSILTTCPSINMTFDHP